MQIERKQLKLELVFKKQMQQQILYKEYPGDTMTLSIIEMFNNIVLCPITPIIINYSGWKKAGKAI